MVNPLNGPQNEQRGPEVLYQQNTLIQQVVHFEYGPELRRFVQGNDASIEQIIQEIIQIKRTMGHMSQVLTEAFAGVRGDAQNQNKNLHDLASQMILSQTRLQESQQRSRKFHVQSWNRWRNDAAGQNLRLSVYSVESRRLRKEQIGFQSWNES